MLNTAQSYVYSSGQTPKRDGRIDGQNDRLTEMVWLYIGLLCECEQSGRAETTSGANWRVRTQRTCCSHCTAVVVFTYDVTSACSATTAILSERVVCQFVYTIYVLRFNRFSWRLIEPTTCCGIVSNAIPCMLN